MRRLKNGKAVGEDEIPGRYGNTEERLTDYLWKLCNRVWSGTDWIEEWNDGMIMKKGEGERVEDYKG